MLFRMGRKDAEDEHKGHGNGHGHDDHDHGDHKVHDDHLPVKIHDDHGHDGDHGHDDHGHHDDHPELPKPNESFNDILKRMLSRGFSKTDFVSLMGSQTLGFTHLDAHSSQIGRWTQNRRWTQNPHVFDNSYYKEVLLEDRSKYLKT